MKERVNTRDDAIGPHTVGRDLLPGDVVLLKRGSKVRARVGAEGKYGWVGDVIEVPPARPGPGRIVTIFYDDKYVLVERGS